MQDPANANDHEDRRGALGELLVVGPRLIRRTRSQAEFAVGVLAALPCPFTAARSHDDDPSASASPPADGLAERTNVLSVLAREDRPVSSTPGAGETSGSTTGETGAVAPEATEQGTAPAVAVAESQPSPEESDLAVPDYDSLAASQVVPRLATLSAEELTAVGRYEQAHRHRQTILNRVAQLLAG